jgi:hypothetical protein
MRPDGANGYRQFRHPEIEVYGNNCVSGQEGESFDGLQVGLDEIEKISAR